MILRLLVAVLLLSLKNWRENIALELLAQITS